MKKVATAWLTVLAVTLCVCLLSAPGAAQPTTNPSSNTVSQDQSAPSQEDPNTATETQTFMGKIVKSGDKLVLTDPASKEIYQLDDQTKARKFLNKEVKVTGVLDASTGTIRVSAIEPA